MADKAEHRTSWGLGLVILFMGVLFGTSRLPGPGARPEGEGGSKPPRAALTGAGGGSGTAERAAAEGGLDYRRPYLEFRDARGAGAIPASEQHLNLGELLARDVAVTDPQFLIATVPDPVDSRLGYRFDAMLDAVQMAVESQGWFLDRFWLPWWPSGRQFSDRAELIPVLSPETGTELSRSQPGVLLFRKPREEKDTDPSQRILVVLLVGETPTSGIAKGALAECLTILKSYHHGLVEETFAFDPFLAEIVAPVFGCVDVRIVGPVYSGSDQSLALALSQWFADEKNRGPGWCWNVFVRSGNAEKIDKGKFERDAGSGRWPNFSVRFNATVLHLDTVMPALFDFLRTLNGGTPLGKVALLTESDTKFGNFFSSKKNEIGKWTDSSPREIVTRMTFPFHISQVAVAYNQSAKKDDQSTPALIRPSSRLTIPFDETGQPRDVVPALSPAMTTATNSFVLAKILETISTEDFRYIGIIATDTRDTIFLAGLIQEFCPDVQLFAPAGDLLLGHPQYTKDLRGMIVASSYPLFSMAQRWDPPHEGDHRRHLFSDDGDEGTYNATLSLLYETSRPPPNPHARFFNDLYDYGPPFDELADLEALWKPHRRWGVPWRERGTDKWELSWNPSSMRPAIWFSVIGQRGLWPVKYTIPVEPTPAAKGQNDNSSYTFDATCAKAVNADRFIAQFPPLLPLFTWQWGTMFLGLSAVAWLLCAIHVRLVSAPGAELGFSLSWAEILRPLDTGRAGPIPSYAWKPGDRAQRELFVLTGLGALSVVYAYSVLLPCWVTFGYSPAALFLDLPSLPYVSTMLWEQLCLSDQHNLRFAWIALYVGHVTLFALLATILLRLWLWWKPDLTLNPWLSIGILVAIAFLCWVPAVCITLLTQWLWTYQSGRYSPLLTFERAVNFGSGVSPIVPVLMLALVLGLWVWSQVRRIYLAERFWGPLPARGGPAAPAVVPQKGIFEPDKGSLAHEWLERIRVEVTQVRLLIQCWLPGAVWVRGWVLAVVGLWGITLIRLWQRALPTPDFPRLLTPIIISVIWILALSIVLTLSRFVILWVTISAMLRQLAGLPMVHAFDRIPAQFSRSFGRYLDRIWPSLALLKIPIQQWATVAAEFHQAADEFRRRGPRTVEPARKANEHPHHDLMLVTLEAVTTNIHPSTQGVTRYHYVLRPYTGGEVARDSPDDSTFSRIERAVATGDPDFAQSPPRGPQAAAFIQKKYSGELTGSPALRQDEIARSESWLGLGNAARACFVVLVPFWETRPAAAGFGEPPAAGSDGAATRDTRPEDALQRWVEAAEDLIALQVVTLVSQCAIHLKNLAYYLAVAPILLLMAVTSYPFQPQRFLQVCLVALLLAVVASVVTVYIRMERNELLSRVSKTTPNAIAFDQTFLTTVLTFIVPLVGIMLAQFPYVSDTLNQWLGPITGVLK